MPPVFGPVSPSPMRLKSRAGASGIAFSPSHSASSESSTPCRNSSTTTGTSPKRCSTSISVERRARLGLVARDHDALARGQAVGLDHGRVARDRVQARLDAVHDRVLGRRHARGDHDLLGVGLGALELARRRRSARSTGTRASRPTKPATSGASGPTTTRSMSAQRRAGGASPRDPGVARASRTPPAAAASAAARARSRARGPRRR